MREFFDAFGGPNNAMSFIVPLTFLLGVLGLVAFFQWRRHRRAELDANLMQQVINLKQQMIEKGMSADEIERVLTVQPAGSSHEGLRDRLPLQETASYRR